LAAGAGPSSASARAANFAAAFFSAALLFFTARGAASVFDFDCAPSWAAPLANATTAQIRNTDAHRRPAFSIFMLCSPVNRTGKV
jgi:hypothetical protein